MASTVEKRLELHNLLSEICENCYFEPPTGFQLTYPCIIYQRTNNMVDHANNNPYKVDTRYTVTIIDPDPDSELVPKIEMLPKCSYSTHLTVDDLNHDIFTLYY